MIYSYPQNINLEVSNTENCVKLLGVEIDNKLSFHTMQKGK